ncbi:MAG: hypothetical protein O3C43_02615 [Verrucomicrobia bacterium]|nr:hypothetical protein [Verrucomicrobiota bacterium]MDA1065376.1 hypothetical protein [Verrucomicrobiota bacterium]
MKPLVLIFPLSLFCSLLPGQNNVSLLEKSPFMPPGKAASANANEVVGPASLAKLQLRGITSIDGEYIFSVYNPDTRESMWLSKDIEEEGLVVKSYDPDGNTVVIHSESENLSRQMKMNDYAASTVLRAPPTVTRQAPPPSMLQAPGTPAVRPTIPTSSLSATQQAIERPTRRNLETLRARREELADKLRKQPPSTDKPQSGTTPGQGNGDKR